MTGQLTKFLRDRSGAGAVEFAIVAMVLVGTMLAIFDMSRVFYEYNQSVKACQQGVRFAVTNYMVAPGLADFTATTCDAGDPLDTADLPSPNRVVCTCDGISGDPATCTGTITCNAFGSPAASSQLAFDLILREMAKIYPRLAADPDATVAVAYEAIPGGFCQSPSGPDILALTTVSIGGLDFDFSVPLVGAIGSFEFPRCSATMTSEDLSTCGNGTSPYDPLPCSSL